MPVIIIARNQLLREYLNVKASSAERRTLHRDELSFYVSPITVMTIRRRMSHRGREGGSYSIVGGRPDVSTPSL